MTYKPNEKDLETVYEWAKKGAIYKEMANALGISMSTFARRLEYFADPIKKGRKEAIEANIKEVTNSLIKKCIGYQVTDIKTIKKKDESGQMVIVEEQITKKTIPASDVAIFFYLVNRDPENWQSVNAPQKEGEGNKGFIREWFEKAEKKYKDRVKKEQD